jgi:glucosamine-6-phosphate deaminase
VQINVFKTEEDMAAAAAETAARELRSAIERRGRATFVAATGSSQFTFLAALTRIPDIEWSRTTMFHLDEYVGIGADHPASFRRYLNERLVSRVTPGIGEVHLIRGDAPDPAEECRRLEALVRRNGVDVAFVGVGENGHLAFNEPPADFDTRSVFQVVELDERSRRQQVGEGWFSDLEEVPRKAITMTVPAILSASAIVCTVPGARKAAAVLDCFGGPVSRRHPASALQGHDATTVYLDRAAAAELESASRGAE